MSLNTSSINQMMAAGFADSSARVFSMSEGKVSHLIACSFNNGCVGGVYLLCKSVEQYFLC